MIGLLKKTLKKIKIKFAPWRISTSLSDNQAYPQVCLDASNNYNFFNSFRRNSVYNQILEHVSEIQGQQYLDLISKDGDLIKLMDLFAANDDYGNPRVFAYPIIGKFSPSTLRYVKVLADLKFHFHKIDDLSICEIGVGYGGQCRVINAFCAPSYYFLIDIQPALALAQRYLGNYITQSILKFKTMNELPPRDFDLVISNYAFTELPRAIQDVYLQKVILRSKRGYITFNDINPTNFNSYKLSELVSMIPGAKVFAEEPLTHPKNCIIVWGSNS